MQHKLLGMWYVGGGGRGTVKGAKGGWSPFLCFVKQETIAPKKIAPNMQNMYDGGKVLASGLFLMLVSGTWVVWCGVGAVLQS